uniref:Cytochrome c biogenesis F n=1 Tax=Welwitschia mirabilis TaxID=3377 RepID=A0A0X9V4A8_WELMI|nr:cytochrome c biogenesis F [Welwitschia mirabilis]AMA20990.1 cytochrome c biogenesis F [Welwitschia mirabilis]QXE44326.1 cytochrome c biogenesis FN [Welwitschia mirabilis]
MSINELCHYLLWKGVFVAFTTEKSRASGAFFFTLLSTYGLFFCHTSNNFSVLNVFTNSNASAPLLYQISGTWSSHEGSILLWCWILSLYGFLFRYRVQPRSHYYKERGGRRETAKCSTLLSSFVKNSPHYALPRYENKSGAAPLLKYTPFVPLLEAPYRALLQECGCRGVLASQYKAPLLDYLLSQDVGGRFMRRSRNEGSREAKRSRTSLSTSPGPARNPAYTTIWRPIGVIQNEGRLLRTVARNPQCVFRYAYQDRASPVDEHWISNPNGIYSIYTLFCSNPFVRNSFVCTESLAFLNPVLQDPINAIHPPCIYAGAAASAMGFGLCIMCLMNGIYTLYSPMQKLRRTLPSSSGCARARGWIELFTLTDKCHPCLLVLLLRNRSLLMLLRRRFARLLRPLRALMDTGREQAKRVVRNGRKDTTTKPICFAGANTAVSDPLLDREQIRIWISTCWWLSTVGILLGSWWAYHELGWGGWWFWDPVENASLMPWVNATACIHSVKLPKASIWTLFLSIVTLNCCVSGTTLIRSGLLTSVHSFAAETTRGITLLWWFFLLITGISLILLSQMKQRTSVRPSSIRASSIRLVVSFGARTSPGPARAYIMCCRSRSVDAVGESRRGNSVLTVRP